MTTYDIEPIENGVQQSYIEIRESLELILASAISELPDGTDWAYTASDLLIELDDAVSNNWDELMAAFWRGVAQEVALMEGN